MENLPYLDRNLWESQRFNAYVTALVNSKKKLKPLDVCTFKWEQKEGDEADVEISDKDIKRLKELSKKWEGKS